MAFWSGEKLDEQLNVIMPAFDPAHIDCAAYTLHVGPEVYVTPDHDQPKPSSHTKKKLGDGEPFTIPAGQFGFILTEEEVFVPDDAIAFISIKSKSKFKGLINVSGFHVDPGYKGRLIFSVFNAGPAPVHLERGMALFLIWYADLDRKTDRKKTHSGHNNIHPDLINGIPGEVYSFRMLSKQMIEIETRTTSRMNELEKSFDNWHKVLVTVVLLLIAIIGGPWLSKLFTMSTEVSKIESPNSNSAQPFNEVVQDEQSRPDSDVTQSDRAPNKLSSDTGTNPTVRQDVDKTKPSTQKATHDSENGCVNNNGPTPEPSGQ